MQCLHVLFREVTKLNDECSLRRKNVPLFSLLLCLASLHCILLLRVPSLNLVVVLR